MQDVIKGIFGMCATFLIYILGGWDIALQCLIVFMIVDYITGISKSYVSGKLNSNKGLKGFVKKVCMLLIVVIATFIDYMLGNSGLIRTSTIYGLVANEGLSIIENFGEMNILVPKVLKDKLEQLKEVSEGESK